MWPFKSKPKVDTYANPKGLDVLSKLAHDKALKLAEQAISKVHKEGRLVFKDGENVEYIERDGKRSLQTIESLSWLMWGKLNDEVASKLQGGSLAMVNVDFKDIQNIILKVRGA